MIKRVKNVLQNSNKFPPHADMGTQRVGNLFKLMAIRVLHLVYDFTPGGIERWVLSMLRAANKDRVEMDFCCWGPVLVPEEIPAEIRELGSKVFHCPLRATLISFVQGLVIILKNNSYDIVHNHMQIHSGISVMAAKQCGTTVITSFHNTNFAPQTIFRFPLLHKLRELYGYLSINYAVSQSDLITGCSQVVLDTFSSKGRLPTERAKVLYYGVKVNRPPGEDERRAFREELGVPEAGVVITNVARFLPQKNYAGLIRVAERVISQDRRAHFVLVGDGPLRPEMEALVKARGLSWNFSFLGIRSDVERILSCSDIFFFPSLWEGLGLVIMEAMAAGLPVVASDLPVFKETIVDGKTGILWPLKDEAGLASRLLDFVVNPDKRQNMGEAGRERVKTRFSLEQAAKGLCEVYESLSHS